MDTPALNIVNYFEILNPLWYTIKNMIRISTALHIIMIPLSGVIFISDKSFIKTNNCSENMNFENFLIVSLNIDSIGRKARTIITGTVMDVADIWLFTAVPIAAPKRKEHMCPTSITSKNLSNVIPVYPVEHPITSEPSIQIDIM